MKYEIELNKRDRNAMLNLRLQVYVIGSQTPTYIEKKSRNIQKQMLLQY